MFRTSSLRAPCELHTSSLLASYTSSLAFLLKLSLLADVCQLGRRLMAGALTPDARAAKRRLGRREYISCDADETVTTLNGNNAIVNTLVGNYREIYKNHGRKSLDDSDLRGRNSP